MMPDTILKHRGMDVLSKALGIVEAERFITLILREQFDYTEWRKDLYNDMSVDDLYSKVKSYAENKRKKQNI